eukprot:g70621.t1
MANVRKKSCQTNLSIEIYFNYFREKWMLATDSWGASPESQGDQTQVADGNQIQLPVLGKPAAFRPRSSAQEDTGDSRFDNTSNISAPSFANNNQGVKSRVILLRRDEQRKHKNQNKKSGTEKSAQFRTSSEREREYEAARARIFGSQDPHVEMDLARRLESTSISASSNGYTQTQPSPSDAWDGAESGTHDKTDSIRAGTKELIGTINGNKPGNKNDNEHVKGNSQKKQPKKVAILEHMLRQENEAVILGGGLATGHYNRQAGAGNGYGGGPGRYNSQRGQHPSQDPDFDRSGRLAGRGRGYPPLASSSSASIVQPQPHSLSHYSGDQYRGRGNSASDPSFNSLHQTSIPQIRLPAHRYESTRDNSMAAPAWGRAGNTSVSSSYGRGTSASAGNPTSYSRDYFPTNGDYYAEYSAEYDRHGPGHTRNDYNVSSGSSGTASAGYSSVVAGNMYRQNVDIHHQHGQYGTGGSIYSRPNRYESVGLGESDYSNRYYDGVPNQIGFASVLIPPNQPQSQVGLGYVQGHPAGPTVANRFLGSEQMPPASAALLSAGVTSRSVGSSGHYTPSVGNGDNLSNVKGEHRNLRQIIAKATYDDDFPVLGRDP